MFEISKISGVHNIVKQNLPDLYNDFLHISKLYRTTNRYYKPALHLSGLYYQGKYIISLVFTKTKPFDTNIEVRNRSEIILNYETHCEWNSFISIYKFLEHIF